MCVCKQNLFDAGHMVFNSHLIGSMQHLQVQFLALTVNQFGVNQFLVGKHS